MGHAGKNARKVIYQIYFMKRLFFFFSLMLLTSLSFAQNYTRYDIPEQESKMNIGLGIGLDYGGIGGRITFLPVKRLALFAGVGYALVDFGYNLGAQLRIIPDNKFLPDFWSDVRLQWCHQSAKRFHV